MGQGEREGKKVRSKGTSLQELLHYLEVSERRHKEVREEPESSADGKKELKLVYAEAPVATQAQAPHFKDHLQVKEDGESNLRA